MSRGVVSELGALAGILVDVLAGFGLGDLASTGIGILDGAWHGTLAGVLVGVMAGSGLCVLASGEHQLIFRLFICLTNELFPNLIPNTS